jgi:hypothetical protein
MSMVSRPQKLTSTTLPTILFLRLPRFHRYAASNDSSPRNDGGFGGGYDGSNDHAGNNFAAPSYASSGSNMYGGTSSFGDNLGQGMWCVCTHPLISPYLILSPSSPPYDYILFHDLSYLFSSVCTHPLISPYLILSPSPPYDYILFHDLSYLFSSHLISALTAIHRRVRRGRFRE